MEKVYKIGDIARIYGITVKTIRYYEKIGILVPHQIDQYTNYRYYDDENIKELNIILKLKELNFSLKQIKSFTDSSLEDKILELDKKIQELKEKKRDCLDLIFFNNHEKNKNKYYGIQHNVNYFLPKVFENDKQAIGLWQYIGTLSNGNSKNELEYKKNAFCKNLFFLKQGKGFYAFRGWTKGKLFFSEDKYLTYKIEEDTLYLTAPSNFYDKNPFEKNDDNFVVQAYKKVDNKERTFAEHIYRDNLDTKSEIDKKYVGLWSVCDHVFWNDIDNYVLKANDNLAKSNNHYFIKGISLYESGRCILDEDNDLRVYEWANNYIKDMENNVLHELEIRKIDNEEYLILKLKTDSYFYDNEFYWFYILKRN